MLVLSRMSGQAIFIDGDLIKVRVVSIKGDKVRLGIEAPSEIPIHREEVYEMIHGPKKDQTQTVPAEMEQQHVNEG